LKFIKNLMGTFMSDEPEEIKLASLNVENEIIELPENFDSRE